MTFSLIQQQTNTTPSQYMFLLRPNCFPHQKSMCGEPPSPPTAYVFSVWCPLSPFNSVPLLPLALFWNLTEVDDLASSTLQAQLSVQLNLYIRVWHSQLSLFLHFVSTAMMIKCTNTCYIFNSASMQNNQFQFGLMCMQLEQLRVNKEK